MTLKTETWGQPPVYCYIINSNGVDMSAIQLNDYYGRLVFSDQVEMELFTNDNTDVEDMALFHHRVQEPTITWENLKRNLTQNGLL